MIRRIRPAASRAALIPLIAIAAALSACSSSPGGHAESPRPPSPPVVSAVRRVCTLAADNPDAATAHIRGFDGATSIVAGHKSYWFFGDTLRSGAGGVTDVIPAAVATSDDFDGHDCVRLSFKMAAGTAEPLFPRLDETTAWPDGVIALDDGSMAFYMVRTYRTSPFAWHVGAVGLGRIAAGSTDGTREVETIWDENSGFGTRIVGARSPVRVGDDVYVFLHTERNDNFVARAPVDRIGDAAAYTYWTGDGWSARPQDAAPMWPNTSGILPADNGVSVSYDERAGAWIAIYNAGLGRVESRAAEDPWGPWSAPVTWFDCRTLVEDVYPYCYSAEPHRELSSDPGVLYLTFSSQKPYDVTMVELRFE